MKSYSLLFPPCRHLFLRVVLYFLTLIELLRVIRLGESERHSKAAQLKILLSFVRRHR
jgi:hypothetical protein